MEDTLFNISEMEPFPLPCSKTPGISLKLYCNQNTAPDMLQQQKFWLSFGEMGPKSVSSGMWEVYCLTKEGRNFHRQNKGSS